MSDQKRSRYKISVDEANAEQFLNKIPSALLELQKRGFLLPRKEQLEVDQLFEGANEEEKQEKKASFGQVLNVFEQHEQKMGNALTGIYKTSVKNSSSLLSQTSFSSDSETTNQSVSSAFNEQTWNSLGQKEGSAVSNESVRAPIRTFTEPGNVLSLLSNGKVDKILGENGTMNFQFPEFKSQQPAKAKIEIGKLIEQVNIHAQDISGGSQQLVKVLKEKLVEILKDELDTGY